MAPTTTLQYNALKILGTLIFGKGLRNTSFLKIHETVDMVFGVALD